MKKVLLIAALFAVSAAQATGINTGDTTNNNQTYNQPGANANGYGGQGGSGGAGGSSVAGAAALAGAVSSASVGDVKSSATGGSVLGSGNSSNKNDNTNLQGQQQGQGQSQSSKSNAQQAQSTENANNSKQSVTVNGDTYEAAHIPVSTAYAPNVSPTAVCALSASGGLSVSTFSISGGGTWIDENCVLLEQVRRANEIGQREIAAEMMMDVPAYAKAAKRVADRKSGKVSTAPSTVSSDKVAAAKPEYADPIIRARLGLPPLK